MNEDYFNQNKTQQYYTYIGILISKVNNGKEVNRI